MKGSRGRSYPKGITKVRYAYMSNAAYESAVSLVVPTNTEFYNLVNRGLEKMKSKTQAYVAVSKSLQFHVHSMIKNRKPYKERKF
jgi:hypothetical protein